jgi:hypothetical protein
MPLILEAQSLYRSGNTTGAIQLIDMVLNVNRKNSSKSEER